MQWGKGHLVVSGVPIMADSNAGIMVAVSYGAQVMPVNCVVHKGQRLAANSIMSDLMEYQEEFGAAWSLGYWS